MVYVNMSCLLSMPLLSDGPCAVVVSWDRTVPCPPPPPAVLGFRSHQAGQTRGRSRSLPLMTFTPVTGRTRPDGSGPVRCGARVGVTVLVAADPVGTPARPTPDQPVTRQPDGMSASRARPRCGRRLTAARRCGRLTVTTGGWEALEADRTGL